MGFSKMNLTEERIKDIYQQILLFDPVWMILQPSIAILLARCMYTEEVPVLSSLKYIELTGEMLTEENKRFLEAAFECPCVNQYGSYEVNSMAYECPAGHLHVLDENVYLEIIKAERQSRYEEISRVYKEDILENAWEKEGLSDENILLADLSKEQVKVLRGTEGVIIEKDAIMDGASENEADQTGMEEALQELADGEWNRKALHVEENPVGDSRIKIAVLDSGRDIYADYSIEEAVDLVQPKVEGFATDTTGHGTAVQTILGARDKYGDNAGVAVGCDNISMYSIKVLDENNQAPVSRIMDCL